jgi:hypothetical protein
MERPTIAAKVTSYVKEFIQGKETTFYVLKLKSGKSSWELKKRYSEFDALRIELLENHGNIPDMPGKSLFSLKRTDQFEKRRAGLEVFIQKCVDRQDLYSNQAFVEFLKVSRE